MSKPTALPIILLLLLGLPMGGCAGVSHSRFAGLLPDQARLLAHRMENENQRLIAADLQSAFNGGAPVNVLVLSNGGAAGAFGSGVLQGWRASQKGRPKFDIVTGVSTGALMATFAFLGEPQDDATLRQVYTRTSDQDVFEGPLDPGPFDSVFGTRPLKHLIARYVTADVIQRVADAHRQGRRLYVATADLDSGLIHIWPMSRMAAEEGPACADRFRRVLLAAAAIPVVFPPVEIEGDLHVDAGLRETMLLRPVMLGHHPAPAGAEPTVWAIVNNKLHSAPQGVPDDLVHIGIRSLDMYTNALLEANLQDVAHIAQCHAPPYQFRYMAIPDEVDQGPPPGLTHGMFDSAVMSRLYKVGQEMGRAEVAWRQDVQ